MNMIKIKLLLATLLILNTHGVTAGKINFVGSIVNPTVKLSGLHKTEEIMTKKTLSAISSKASEDEMIQHFNMDEVDDNAMLMTVAYK